MKKNKMMRIASVLLVAALISTCAISGTFAKYVTSGEASDTARVAKFGVEVTGSSDLFAKTYKADDETFTIAADSVVSSSATDKLVAPGTSGSLTKFAMTGKPEVAVRVTYTVDEFALENWELEDGSFYCPLQITVGSTTLNGLDYTSADGFEYAVTSTIAALTNDYKAKTDLASVVDADGLAISWAWPFDSTSSNFLSGQTDENDTYLGKQAADDNAATIALTVTCTVTQID